MPVPETHEGGHPEPSKGNYLLNADGSGTGTTDNPAQGAIGVVLRDPDGHLIAEISESIGPAINTVAECRALIEGLKLARSRGIHRIRVFLDSELVVDQVNGRAKVGKEHITPCTRKHAPCSRSSATPGFRGFRENGMPKRTHLQPKRFLVAERSGAHRPEPWS
jgi:ribonuclease HI